MKRLPYLGWRTFRLWLADLLEAATEPLSDDGECPCERCEASRVGLTVVQSMQKCPRPRIEELRDLDFEGDGVAVQQAYGAWENRPPANAWLPEDAEDLGVLLHDFAIDVGLSGVTAGRVARLAAWECSR